MRLAVPAALASITALTALSGYLRELALAAAFGASFYTDGYFVAAAVPMAVGDLLIGSALTASIVPVFARLTASGVPTDSRFRQGLSACYYLLVVTAFALAGILFEAMPEVVRLLSPGFDGDAQRYTVGLGRALVWLIPLNGVVLLSSLLLNAARAYIVPAFAWLVINLIFVATVYLGYRRLGADVLVWGPLLGPAAMALMLLARLRALRLHPGASADFSSPALREILRLSRPMVSTLGVGSAMGILMICHLMLRAFGSTLGEGAVSAFGYAFRLYEVPVSLVAATAGTLVFTEMSRLSHDSEPGQSAQRCRELLAWAGLSLFPLVIVTAIFADGIVGLLLQKGAFSHRAAVQTSDALRGFSPAILFESIVMVGLRILYALRQPKAAVMVGLVTISCLAIAAWAVSTRGSLVLLAGTLSASFAIAAAMIVALISRTLGASVLPEAREWLAALALSVLAGAVVNYVRKTMPTSGLGYDAALLVGYAALYIAGLAALCPRRLRQLRSLIRAAR